MKSDTDLTLFWLAWKKTCSIRLCCTGHESEYLEKCADDSVLCNEMPLVQKLASDVMASMNRTFQLYLRKREDENGARLSSLDIESNSWNERYNLGSAFELLESHLYGRQNLNGKAFKSYLFEDIGVREGGINKNLYGYLQAILRTIINESFGENVYMPLMSEDGTAVEPNRISFDGSTVLNDVHTPDEYAEENEIKDEFSRFLAEKETWDSDHWLVAYCILNLLRVGNAKIQPMFSKGHQTINVLCTRMKGDLLRWLRSRFSDNAIGMSLNGSLQEILDGYVKKMPWYDEMKKILEENRKSTGK